MRGFALMPQENISPFSILTPVVLQNAEGLQELESTGGLIGIKCADAPKQNAKASILDHLVGHLENEPCRASFANLPESSPCYSVSDKCAKGEDYFYNAKLWNYRCSFVELQVIFVILTNSDF